jgi:2-oxoglutarate dehydrogenase E2 component (dihydrolipoamide succinyltransferase)
MTIEIKVPSLGESVTEATVAKWFKQAGEPVAADEPLVSLETDKVALDVYAPVAGRLERIVAAAGANVAVNAVLGAIAESGAAAVPERPTPAAASRIPDEQPKDANLSPAVRALVEQNRLDPHAIPGSGKGGRVLKGDVLARLEKAPAAQAPAPSLPARPPASSREERVPMSRLRRTIAERLKEAQNTAAMLTTFNEVDMSAVIALRTAYREEYEKRHGVKLGFMSFFVKAAVVALRDIPSVNAQIDGDDIVYKNHYDIGVAISAPRGLVVPVLRDADQLSFAEIEKRIAALAQRARDGQLTLAELQGGTFTITNGGVFG